MTRNRIEFDQQDGDDDGSVPTVRRCVLPDGTTLDAPPGPPHLEDWLGLIARSAGGAVST
jgi:hypothetical protein